MRRARTVVALVAAGLLVAPAVAEAKPGASGVVDVSGWYRLVDASGVDRPEPWDYVDAGSELSMSLPGDVSVQVRGGSCTEPSGLVRTARVVAVTCTGEA